MSNTNTETKKYVCLGLLAVLLLMLFVPWITPTDAFKYEYSDFSEDLRDEINYTIDNMLEYSNYLPTNLREDVLNLRSDLQSLTESTYISPYKIVRTISLLNRTAKLTEKIWRSSDYGYYYDSSEIGKAFSAAKTVMDLFFTYCILSILLAAVMLCLKKKNYGVLQIIGTTATLTFFIIAILALNVAGVSEEIGSIVKITAWPIIAILCSVGSYILAMQYMNESNERVTNVSNVNAGAVFAQIKGVVSGAVNNIQKTVGHKAWICPKCGADCTPGADFCPGCGEPRPEPKKCQQCGAVMVDDADFCRKCGAKYEVVSFCGFCGKKLINDEKCNCQNEQAEPAEPTIVAKP